MSDAMWGIQYYANWIVKSNLCIHYPYKFIFTLHFYELQITILNGKKKAWCVHIQSHLKPQHKILYTQQRKKQPTAHTETSSKNTLGALLLKWSTGLKHFTLFGLLLLAWPHSFGLFVSHSFTKKIIINFWPRSKALKFIVPQQIKNKKKGNEKEAKWRIKIVEKDLFLWLKVRLLQICVLESGY